MGFFDKVAGKITSYFAKQAGKAVSSIRGLAGKALPFVAALTGGLTLIPGINVIAAPIFGLASAGIALETTAQAIEAIT